MYVFHRADAMRHYLAPRRSSLGFVPTMGALHEGHLQLVRHALQECELVVCSIFVNPTQFNDPDDLRKYPRTPDQDIAMLARAGCHLVFMPAVEEVYPPAWQMPVALQLGLLDQVMEGKFRPGHFKGVAEVVYRLLELVEPQRLYMGQKDFQQTVIVQAMLQQTNLPVALRVADTVREDDGLAMSSRNRRLSPEQRQAAPYLYRALLEARRLYPELPVSEIQARAMALMQRAGLCPEYFDIVDGRTLQPVVNGAKYDYVVACAAAWAGEVRLIDNVTLRR